MEAAYGAPGEAGFGSAVFQEVLKDTDELSQAAEVKYRTLVGQLWEQSALFR